MNLSSPSPSKPPKKKKQRTKSSTQGKMATTQQGACTNSVFPNDNLSQSVQPIQPIQQVGNLTYHQLQPMQCIQSAHAPMQTHMQHQPQNVQSNTPQVTPQWVSDIVTQLKNMNQKSENGSGSVPSRKCAYNGKCPRYAM